MLIKILELDPLEQREFSRALILDSVDSPKLRSLLKKELLDVRRNRKTLIDVRQDELLAEWWVIPVMESLTLSTDETPADIQERLGVSKAQWNAAVSLLVNEGIVHETEQGYKKKEDHLYVSTGRSKASVRTFHKKMIGRALGELEKTQESDFQRRLITGYTFALAPEYLEEIKTMIMRFLDKASRRASEGECKEVYQLNIQFFPLTKKTK